MINPDLSFCSSKSASDSLKLNDLNLSEIQLFRNPSGMQLNFDLKYFENNSNFYFLHSKISDNPFSVSFFLHILLLKNRNRLKLNPRCRIVYSIMAVRVFFRDFLGSFRLEEVHKTIVKKSLPQS